MLVGLAVLALAFFVAPDPRPRALPVPVRRLGGDPRRRLVRWRIAYIVSAAATFAEHVRRPDHALPGQPRRSGTGSAIGDAHPVAGGRRPSSRSSHTAVFVWVARSELRRSPLASDRPSDLADGELAGRTRRCAGRWRSPRRSRTWRPRGRPAAAAPARRVGVGRSPRSRGGRAGRLPRRRRAPPGDGDSDAPVLPDLERAPPRSARSASSAGSGRGSPSGPIRADRSRALDGERGGRLDRLDVWLLVVLVVARSASACCGSPSRTRCTSTRSTTREPPRSSCRTGGTASRTTSTSGPTRTSPSTRWPAGSSRWARRGQRHERPRRAGRRRGDRAAPRRRSRPATRAGDRV